MGVEKRFQQNQKTHRDIMREIQYEDIQYSSITCGILKKRGNLRDLTDITMKSNVLDRKIWTWTGIR